MGARRGSGRTSTRACQQRGRSGWLRCGMTDPEASNSRRHAAADALWAFRRDASPMTRAERQEAGRALRQRVPRSSHADWTPGRATRPDRRARGAGRRRGCPSWCRSATAGWRSRRSPSSAAAAAIMAMDLATDAGDRPPGAGVRRRARRQLREVRHARAQPGLRHQRLRRDAARAVGVGRQAARAPACTSSPAQRGFSPRAVRPRWSRRRPAPTASASRVRDAMRTLDALVRPHPTSSEVIDHFPPQYRPQVKRDVQQGAAQGPRPRRRQAHPRPSTGGVRFAEDPPLIVHLDDTEHDMDDVDRR